MTSRPLEEVIRPSAHRLQRSSTESRQPQRRSPSPRPFISALATRKLPLRLQPPSIACLDCLGLLWPLLGEASNGNSPSPLPSLPWFGAASALVATVTVAFVAVATALGVLSLCGAARPALSSRARAVAVAAPQEQTLWQARRHSAPSFPHAAGRGAHHGFLQFLLPVRLEFGCVLIR